MNIQGSHTIPAPPARVFDALMDPTVLQRCIPGCEKMEKSAEDEYHALLKIGIAAVKGAYTGKVRITDKNPPCAFILHMEGKGTAGFVKGQSAIQLKPEGNGTHLAYSAEAHVGGLIAAVGSRLIEAAAKKLAAEFFARFTELITNATNEAK